MLDANICLFDSWYYGFWWLEKAGCMIIIEKLRLQCFSWYIALHIGMSTHALAWLTSKDTKLRGEVCQIQLYIYRLYSLIYITNTHLNLNKSKSFDESTSKHDCISSQHLTWPNPVQARTAVALDSRFVIIRVVAEREFWWSQNGGGARHDDILMLRTKYPMLEIENWGIGMWADDNGCTFIFTIDYLDIIRHFLFFLVQMCSIFL